MSAADPQQIADFGGRVPGYLQRLREAMDQRLPAADTDPARLHAAMRYACAGGKRIRGLLVYAAGEALRVPLKALDAPACAVEFIHAYSLVHDDLPAMDDDDLRRGQPTVHKAYDEATAILAGDALQTLAFEVLTAQDGVTSAAQRLRGVAVLTQASGSLGMVGGQAVDMESEGKNLSLIRLQSLHARKTGALILACLRLAHCAAGASLKIADALDDYGRHIGLGFQIQDDVLDETVSTEQLGKTAGKDLASAKSTYPALLGLDGARARAEAEFKAARDALDSIPGGAPQLRWLANHIEQRQN